jgi:hypothetical protein
LLETRLTSQQFSGFSVFIKGSWDTATFVTTYLPLALFPVLYFGARLYTRQQFVTPAQMDFVSNIAEIEAESYDEPPPRNRWEAFWQWLVRTAFFSFCVLSAPTRFSLVSRRIRMLTRVRADVRSAPVGIVGSGECSGGPPGIYTDMCGTKCNTSMRVRSMDSTLFSACVYFR